MTWYITEWRFSVRKSNGLIMRNLRKVFVTLSRCRESITQYTGSKNLVQPIITAKFWAILRSCFHLAVRSSTSPYQSPLILTELFQHNLINVSYLTECYLYQVMMTLHFLNDVANDAESTQISKITSWWLVWRVFNNG